MLSIDRETLQADAWTRVYVLELDLGNGRVKVEGRTDVRYSRDARGGPELESGASGCHYGEPFMIGDVEAWSAVMEDYYLAVFADEAAMRAGGRELATKWGERLPVGIYRVLMRAVAIGAEGQC
jgi:hypothetical protein